MKFQSCFWSVRSCVLTIFFWEDDKSFVRTWFWLRRSGMRSSELILWAPGSWSSDALRVHKSNELERMNPWIRTLWNFLAAGAWLLFQRRPVSSCELRSQPDQWLSLRLFKISWRCDPGSRMNGLISARWDHSTRMKREEKISKLEESPGDLFLMESEKSGYTLFIVSEMSDFSWTQKTPEDPCRGLRTCTNS